MIFTSRTTIMPNVPAVKVYTALGLANVTMFSDGGGVFIGGNSAITPSTGFQLTALIFPFTIKKDDEIWAIASQRVNLSILVTS